MLKYNFVYELKLLLRSRWIQVLSLLLLILFGFSAFNGKQKLDKRNEIIQNAQQEVEENDQKMLALLDSVSQGMAVSVPRWQIPTSPVAVGNYYPRVAAMESQSMGFIATGQADLFTPFMKPKVYGDDYALNFTEMTSPVQLLFGSFDLAFVIVYLLPLLIIAFSYNVLSAERESGSLRLLVSQPINLRYWVLQKLGLRFFWLSLLVIVTLIIAFLTMDVAIGNELSAFFSLVALTIAYMLFWFALAFIINLWGSSSARNAVSMLGLWVLLVLLVPSVLNQFGASMYPMPSRTVMINEMRTKKIEVAKIQDEILDNYLRDHPEYALNDSTETRTFWHRYMASQKLVKEELEPIVSAYEVQLEKQQALTARFKWVSPPLTMQESLNALAGTSSAD
ncbi:MAG: ABC transporter permease subunit, partial [Bacteroidota bacterium]